CRRPPPLHLPGAAAGDGAGAGTLLPPGLSGECGQQRDAGADGGDDFTGFQEGTAMKFLVINGPNLNMLGIREPQIYGTNTYQDLVEYVSDYCAQRGVETEFVQSNHEGDLVDAIQKAYFDKV